MENKQEKNSDFLGKENIRKLLIKQSVPAIIGLLMLSLYNLVDTIFIGWGVGPLGIAGVAIAFPIQMVLMAIAQMLGIGTASIISRALGSNDKEKAGKALGNFFTMSFIISIMIFVSFFTFLKPLLSLFGASETVMPFAYDYMSIILYGTIFVMFAAGSNSVIRAEGSAKYSMMVMVTSALINLILDPIFIFVFDWGIKGIAWATVIAQVISSVVALMYFIKKRSVVDFVKKDFLLSFKIIKEMFGIGASSLSRMIAGSVMAIIINNSLAFYSGDIAIAAFGIVNRILMIIFMPMFGLVQGLQPILGYNYGAGLWKRVRKTLMLSTRYTTIFSFGAAILLFFLSKPIMHIFTSDAELIRIGSRAIKIIVIMLPTIGFQVIVGGMYQSMGKAWKAFIMSNLRQVLLVIPIVLILPLYYGLDGIWFTFPSADFISAIISVVIFIYEIRHLNNKKEVPGNQNLK
jgi:putative MATE family efflux protein